jgi:type I restriction enzyme, S subunit
VSWPLEKLGTLVAIKTGRLDANAADEEGLYPFFTCSREPLRINTHAFDCDAILIAGNGDLNVKHYSGKFNAYQRTYVVTSLSEEILDTRYLFYFMDKYVERLRELSIGGVIKYIKLGMLTDAEIPLPPLSEQKRIAAILDKADAIRRKRQQAIQLADDFLRAVFLDMFGDPVTNPKGWELKTLGELCTKITDGEHGTVKRLESGRLYLMARNIDRKGNLDLSDVSYISEADHQRIYKRCGPEKGDVLLVCVGATIGKALVVPDIGEFSLARSVALLKPGKEIVSEYLLSLINTLASWACLAAVCS